MKNMLLLPWAFAHAQEWSSTGGGVWPGRGLAWGLGGGRKDERRPSGWGADDGARSTELRRAARRLRHGRRRARERGKRERERKIARGGREEGARSFIEREWRGEGAGEERPAFNTISGVVSLHWLERELGEGEETAASVSSVGGGWAQMLRSGRGSTARPSARHEPRASGGGAEGRRRGGATGPWRVGPTG
jgi:hypothetical protein